MADENLPNEELTEEQIKQIVALQELQEKINEILSSNFDKLSTKDREQLTTTTIKSKQQQKKRRTLASLKNITASFGSSILNSGSSFAPLTNTITGVMKQLSRTSAETSSLGKIVGTVVSGMADGVKTIIDTFEKTSASFEKLSEVGLVDTFDTLRDSVGETFLTVETLEKTLVDQSTKLVLFSGSSVKAARDFKNLYKVAVLNEESFQLMGVSIIEYSESVASYLSYLGQIGKNEINDSKQMAIGHSVYLNNIIQLSQLTGTTRKEVEGQILDITRNDRFQAWQNNKELGEISRATKAVSILTSVSPTAGKGATDMIAAGDFFAAKSEEALKLYQTLSYGGVDGKKLIDNYVHGLITEKDFISQMASALNLAEDNIKENQLAIGDQTNSSTINYAEFTAAKTKFNLLNQNLEQYGTLVGDNRDLRTEQEKERDKKLARTRRDMYEITVLNQQLVLRGDGVITAFSSITDGLNTIVDLVSEIAGATLPESVESMKKQGELNSLIVEKTRSINSDKNEIKTKMEELVNLKKKKESEDESLYEKAVNSLKITFLEERVSMLQRNISNNEIDLNTKKTNLAEMKSEYAQKQMRDSGKSPGSSGGSNTSSGYDSNEPISGKEKTAMTFFTSRGWTKEQAAGLVGNLIQESNLNPTALNARENAQGIAQWRNDRIKNIEKHLGKSLLKSSLDEQLGAVDWELRTGEKRAGSSLKQAKTADQAATIVDKQYERSAGTEVNQRVQNALRLLKSDGIPGSKTGSIMKGPSTGYLVELHGDEMIIPANDEITKRNLGNNLGSDESASTLIDFLNLMNTHVDSMIEFVSESNATQRLYDIV